MFSDKNLTMLIEAKESSAELNSFGAGHSNTIAVEDSTAKVIKDRAAFGRSDDDPKRLKDIAWWEGQKAKAAVAVAAEYGHNDRLNASLLRTLRASSPVVDLTDYHPPPAPPKLAYSGPTGAYNVAERRAKELLRRKQERRQEWRRRFSPVITIFEKVKRRPLPVRA